MDCRIFSVFQGNQGMDRNTRRLHGTMYSGYVTPRNICSVPLLGTLSSMLHVSCYAYEMCPQCIAIPSAFRLRYRTAKLNSPPQRAYSRLVSGLAALDTRVLRRDGLSRVLRVSIVVHPIAPFTQYMFFSMHKRNRLYFTQYMFSTATTDHLLSEVQQNMARIIGPASWTTDR